MDGNRRWARAAGLAQPALGHQAGAEHLGELLRWLADRHIDHASVYVLSADNIRKRSGAEIGYLCRLIETLVPAQLRRSDHWSLHVSGDLSLLPASVEHALENAVLATRGRPGHLTLAIGYDPRADIVTGIRAALRAGPLSAEPTALEDAVTAGLPGGPVKDIDLVIRTSGEQRISGFFPWQTGRAEIFVSPKMWPAFTERDLDEALAFYAAARIDTEV